jgi:hypothetical protein
MEEGQTKAINGRTDTSVNGRTDKSSKWKDRHKP